MGAAVPFFLKFIASVAFSMVMSKMQEKKPSLPERPEQKNSGIQINTQSTKVRLPLLYGQSRVGINRVFVGTSGSDNKYLHIIGALGEGEIEGFSDDVEGVNPVYLNNRLYTEYGASNVYFELFNGTATQTVCSTLNTAISDWTDPLKYTAYIYVRLLYDRDKFQGVPDITVGIKGLKLYDPNITTTAYSNNPALCVYNMLSRSISRGGFGLAGSRIDTADIEATRSYCSTKGWTCNMPVTKDSSIVDNLQLILNNFRGALLKSGTTFNLKFKDLNEEFVVESFDEASIVNGSLQITNPDIFDVPSSIKIQYYAEDGDSDGTSTYKERTFVYTPTEIEPTDGSGHVITIQCLGLSNLDLIQQMAYYHKERSMLRKEFSFTASQKAARLEPLDLITITHDMPGWSAKYGRVTSVSLNPDHTVNLSCIEEHEDFYDDVYDPESLEWYDTLLPSPTNEPVSVVGDSLSEEVYYYRNRSFTRLLLNFSAPDPEDDPFFDYAEVYLKIGTGDYKYMTRSEGDYLVDPVEEGETYYIKLKAVNIFGAKQQDINDLLLSKTIVGKTTTPSNLTSMTAAANGDSVSIFADPVSDPDIEGYEVRLGDVWDGAIFISFNKNCSLRLNGVRPGTHTFWMAAKDNAGNYASTPVSATVKVFIPPGFTLLPTYGSWSWDFATGTHSNTEQTTYDSNDALKCSHTEAFTLTTSTPSDITIASNEVTRTSGADGWNADANSTEFYSGGAYLKFQAISVDEHMMIGLNSDPSTGTSVGTLDYVFYLHQNGLISIRESTSPISLGGITYTVDTILEIVYDGTDIIYSVDGAVVRTVSSIGANLSFYMDSCLYSIDASFEVLAFRAEPILFGLYRTPTYDLNAIEDVRVFGDFLVAFESSSTTWAGVAPSGTTWNDLGAGLTWMNIFNPEVAGKIEAILQYSEDGSNWSGIDFFEVVCAEVTARYIALIIKITDPTLDSNLYLKELNMVAYEGAQ
jgi:hypothetical protein